MSSSSVVTLSSFNILFFTQVLTVLTSSVKYNEYVTDKGKNITISCEAEGNIMWVKENGTYSKIVQTGKLLVFSNISKADGGLYVCFASVLQSPNVTDVVSGISTNNVVNSGNANKSTPTQQIASTETSTTSSSPAPSLSVTSNATIASTTSPLPVVLPTVTTTTIALTNTNTIAASISVSATTTIAPTTAAAAAIQAVEEEEYQAVERVHLIVRTTPGPVTQLYFKASTILGFLIWRFNKTHSSGGYPVRSFTAEYRNISYKVMPYNRSFEHEWSRMDPINIAPNVRQMEVYHLEPNTTYEFRIWANNHLGSGEVVTTNVTTLPETKEEDLIRLLQPDLEKFDGRIWIVAVSVVLGTLVILAIGLCIVLSKECYQSSSRMDFQDGWDGIELIPNIILNPGFSESDGGDEAFFKRTVKFGDDYSDSYDSEESDHEPKMEKFKRKVSVFFTGPTIKRI